MEVPRKRFIKPRLLILLDTRVRECAHQLQDKVLIAKLSAGDMISQEAVYHAKCLVALYNEVERSKQITINGNKRESKLLP